MTYFEVEPTKDFSKRLEVSIITLIHIPLHTELQFTTYLLSIIDLPSVPLEFSSEVKLYLTSCTVSGKAVGYFNYIHSQDDLVWYPMLAVIVTILSLYVLLMLGIMKKGSHVPIVILLKACIGLCFIITFLYEQCEPQSLFTSLHNLLGDKGWQLAPMV